MIDEERTQRKKYDELLILDKELFVGMIEEGELILEPKAIEAISSLHVVRLVINVNVVLLRQYEG